MYNDAIKTYGALDHALTGMCVVQKDYTVLFWNEKLIEWTNITKEKIIGSPLSLFCPAFGEQRYRMRIDAIFQGGPPVIFSSQIHKNIFPAPLPNGKQRIQHVTVSAIPAINDTGHYALFAVEDVTELTQRLFDLDKARFEAELASRAKSDFLANMSHEIRTPMNGVLGMCNILLNTNLSEQQHKYTEMIERSGRTLLHIINDILDFSKVEAGKIELKPTPFDLHKVIEEIVELIHYSAEKKAIELYVDYNESLPYAFIGDHGRIRQIIMNLMSNAVKFTEKGQVIISVTCKKGISDSSTAIAISVKDTGIGIPEEVQPILFNKFIQVDSSTTRRFQGTGLGLAISKQLALLMGGEISLNSKLGEGTEFIVTFELPRADPADVNISSSENEDTIDLKTLGTLSYKVRVLLAEDNIINQAVAVHILENLNCSVDVACNGEEAVNKYKSGDYDIIFMDCQMPILDGYSATRMIRTFEKETGIHTAIVAMTAHAMEGDQEKCIVCGMDDYLSKPIDPKMLRSTIERYCKNRKSTETILLRPTILIAEDESIALRELEQIAKSVFPGCTLYQASDGVEACMLLGSVRPNIFICDILIPNMDGEAVISYLKRNRNFSSTQVIVVTSLLPDDPIITRLYNMRVAQVLFKPFALSTIASVLRNSYPFQENPSDVPIIECIPLIDSQIDYRGLVECSLHGIGVFQDDTFIYSNASLARIMDTTVYEFNNMKYTTIMGKIHVEDREIAEQLFGITDSSDSTPSRKTLRICTSNNMITWTDIYSCPIQHKGEDARLIMATDISEHIKRDKLISSLHTANSKADNEWLFYIRSLIDEIRSPLNAIIGTSKGLLCDQITEIQKKQLSIIDTSATILNSILNDFNDHTSDALDLIKECKISFDLHSAIQEVIEMVAPRIFSHRLEFIVNLSNGLPHKFIGDPGRVRQIITHLISYVTITARDYITLQVGFLNTESATSLEVIFTIETSLSNDQQCKIPENDSDETLMNISSNLRIAQRLIETLGGTLVLNHIKAETICCSCSLPLEKDRKVLKPGVFKPILKGIRILYCDSNPLISTMLSDHLKRIGMRPEACDSIEKMNELLHTAILGNDPFRIAIIDHSPGICDGLKIGKNVKSDESLKSTALVMLASTAKRGDAELVKQAGFDGYLVKPILPSELEGLLAFVLNGSRTQSNRSLVTKHVVLEFDSAETEFLTQGRFENLKVLIAEKKDPLRKSICNILLSTGCFILQAENSSSLSEVLEKEKIDLIIIDTTWAKRNNFSAIQMIRSTCPREQTKIVVLATSHLTVEQSLFRDAGIDDFIIKPVIKTTLLRILHLFYSRESTLSNTQGSVSIVKSQELGLLDRSIVDFKDLFERVGDDKDFIIELLKSFASTLPSELNDLKLAIQRQDFNIVEHLAHKMKGASRNLSIACLITPLQEIEYAGKNCNLNNVDVLFAQTQIKASDFISFMEQL